MSLATNPVPSSQEVSNECLFNEKGHRARKCQTWDQNSGDLTPETAFDLYVVWGPSHLQGRLFRCYWRILLCVIPKSHCYQMILLHSLPKSIAYKFFTVLIGFTHPSGFSFMVPKVGTLGCEVELVQTPHWHPSPFLGRTDWRRHGLPLPDCPASLASVKRQQRGKYQRTSSPLGGRQRN